MATSPTPHSAFTISSGSLCFGALHNIWTGASVPPQRGFPHPRPPVTGGTVFASPIEYSLPAQNGAWNVFQLPNLDKKVTAWFMAHSDVDPEQEIAKILRVAGADCFRNNTKKAAAGIFVVNRYDWDYYDRRSQDEISSRADSIGSDDNAEHATGPETWCGIVDYAEAKSRVLEWKEQRRSERPSSECAASLYLHHAEYMHGRFGFTDDKEAARSFLFFSHATNFEATTFAGLEQKLKKNESPEEWLKRSLREGVNFSGIRYIRNETVKISNLPSGFGDSCHEPPPLPSECFGPYDPSDHILREEDIEDLRRGAKLREPVIERFVEGPWKEHSCNLLNELVASYLEHTVLPRMGNRSVSAAAEAYKHFTHPHGRHLDTPAADFDSALVGARIHTFLSSRVGEGEASVVFDDECIEGICNVIAYVLGEIFELADQRARGCHHPIIPWDIRTAILGDSQLFNMLKFSRVYWEGRGELPLPETRDGSYITWDERQAMAADMDGDMWS